MNRRALPYVTGCGCARCAAKREQHRQDQIAARLRRDRRAAFAQWAAILIGLAVIIGVWAGFNVQ